MKWRLILVIVLIAIIAYPVSAYADVADELEDNIDIGLDNIDFSAVDEVAGDYLGSVVEKVKNIINGEFDSMESFGEVLLSLFGEGIKDLLPELISIFVVLVLLGLIRKMNGGLISDCTDSVVSFVGVTVVLVSVLSMIVGVYRQIYAMLTRVATLAEVSSPILLTLLIANGANSSSAVCRPSMVIFSTTIIELVRAVILPLTVFSLVFSAVNHISSNVRVGKASAFFTNAAGWLLGVLFMLFSAVTTVQGISAATIDGVSYRAAKFAAKSYIPILGGYLADGFDIVAASTTLIKNAFGAVTLLILFFIAAKPLISTLCLNLGLQTVAAISEPMVDERYVKILGGISKTLTFLCVLIIAVCFMFSILMLIAICTANGV